MRYIRHMSFFSQSFQIGDAGDEPLNTVCNSCQAVFLTRNKLFQHIKESGHALHAPSTPLDPSLQLLGKGKKKMKKHKQLSQQ